MIPRVIAGTSRTFLLTGLTRHQSRVTLVPQNYRAPISVIIDSGTASCEPQFSAGFVGFHPQVWRIFIPALSGKMKIQEPLGENGLPMPESSSVTVYLHMVISTMSNTANSFCPPPLVVRFYRLGLARDDRAVLGTSYRRHGKHQQMN